MNKIDRIVFRFLKNKFPNDEIVYQKNQLIRFITKSGKKFVPRRVYGNTVWFYEKQLKSIKSEKNCYLVLVRSEDDVKIVDLRHIPTKETVIDNVVLKVVNKDEKERTIKVSKEVYEKLKSAKGNRTWDEFLEELVINYSKDLEIDYSVLKSEILAAVGMLKLLKQRKITELKLLEKLIDPTPLDKLTAEERGSLENLLKYRLVTVDGYGNRIVCKTVAFGELKVKSNKQELTMYYTPDFCRKYCSLWLKCPLKGKGGKRTWTLPLIGELEELVGRVILDVCE